MADTSVMEKTVSQPAVTMTKPAVVKERQPWLSLRDDFNRLFEEATSMFRFPWSERTAFDLAPLFDAGSDAVTFAPPSEVTERDKDYTVTVEMPGLDEKAVAITVEDDTLTIKAEKKEEKEEKETGRYLSERRYGLCARSFRLPSNVDRDGITACMKNGVLTLTLPKSAENRPAARTVAITAG